MKKFFLSKKTFTREEISETSAAVDFVRGELESIGIPKRAIIKAEMLCEDTLVLLERFAEDDSVCRIKVRRLLGEPSILIDMGGREFDPFEIRNDMSDEVDVEDEDTIRAILFRSAGQNYKYANRGDVNKVEISISEPQSAAVALTLIGMFLGIVIGLIMKFVLPAFVSDGINMYLFSPIRTMFMNMLKVIIAPVIFFSIVTCFSQFKSISEFGRIGAKVMACYMVTSVLAVLVGLNVYNLIQPGEFGFALSGAVEVAEVSVDTNVEISLLDTIINIVPSNFLTPFVESDTLQIIFLAVICGVAVGAIGEYSGVLKELFEACNSLFLTITVYASRLIPLVVMCSIAIMVYTMGIDTMSALLGLIGTVLLGLAGMITVYCLMILILTRLNPLQFLRKSKEGMLTSLTLSSSAAAMPTNMKVCTEKLGVSPRVSNFSIPLGATVNMDGFCVTLTIFSLFLAKAYGVEISSATLTSLLVVIVLLSLGAPGVPGSGLICLGVVLGHINVPVEALGI
ncbi:MAG: dicarboxylate/amino acid:cation symporter, partial [Eubacterium sp.]|nr:dicarboxylate/amino acid:cation symporter [Eubacterium sp.]